MLISDLRKRDLEKQGYRIVGNHSAVKICLWTRKSLFDLGTCYKERFYGIKSHRCVQMTPALVFCLHRCEHCWRDVNYTLSEWKGEVDSASDVLEGCISEHKKFLQGYKGDKKVNLSKFEEAMKPNQFAISLAGDALMYPKIIELVELANKKGTSFVVTNGMRPDVLEKIKPYQLYISLNAFDSESYEKVCKPLVKDGWKRLNKSLKILEKFERGSLRVTLIDGLNYPYIEKWADILKNIKFKFLEVKAGMSVGYASYRIDYKKMLRHEQVKEFCEKLCELTGFKIKDEQQESRVCLIER